MHEDGGPRNGERREIIEGNGGWLTSIYTLRYILLYSCCCFVLRCYFRRDGVYYGSVVGVRDGEGVYREGGRGRRGVRARGVSSAVAGREDVANF